MKNAEVFILCRTTPTRREADLLDAIDRMQV
jgi:hypothetical protein